MRIRTNMHSDAPGVRPYVFVNIYKKASIRGGKVRSHPLKSAHFRDIVLKQYSADIFNNRFSRESCVSVKAPAQRGRTGSRSLGSPPSCVSIPSQVFPQIGKQIQGMPGVQLVCQWTEQWGLRNFFLTTGLSAANDGHYKVLTMGIVSTL